MTHNSVHDMKPGAWGLVAHAMKPYELNGWVKRVIDPTRRHPGDLMFDGSHYMLDLHVPHSTLVLILSENSLRTVASNVCSRYYRVLWGEVCLFVRADQIINPFFNIEKLS